MRSDVGRGALRTRALATACILVFAALLSACGNSGASNDASVLSAGQLDIKLPDGFKVVDGKVQRPAQAAAQGGTGAATAADAKTTGTTIVSTKTDPTTGMFNALGKFRGCLEDEGIKFIGAPDAANPDSPTNDPTYIKGLTTCAASSNIVQAMQAAQSANDNLTPAQIKLRNKGYLIWRSCMVDRGWKIATPVPDSQGRLFNFGTSGSQNQIQAPPGKDILSSKDVQDCAKKSTKAVGTG